MKNSNKNSEFRVSVSPGSVVKTLVISYLVLLGLHVFALVVQHGLGYNNAMGLVPFLHFDVENNLPTLYSGFLLLSIVGLLTITWIKERRSTGRLHLAWLLLAVGFGVMFFDEMFAVHELISTLINDYVETTGIFTFVWIVPYLILVVVLGLVLSSWFFALDRATQGWFLVSGLIYLAGAIGSEMIAGVYYSTLAEDREQWRTLPGDLLATVEETMEMLGLSLFIVALVRRLHRDGVRIVFTAGPFGSDAQAEPPA